MELEGGFGISGAQGTICSALSHQIRHVSAPAVEQGQTKTLEDEWPHGVWSHGGTSEAHMSSPVAAIHMGLNSKTQCLGTGWRAGWEEG